MTKSAWLKWASKNEIPTHKVTCPKCGGSGRHKIGFIDDTPLYEQCWRCKGTGEIGAVVVKSTWDIDQ